MRPKDSRRFGRFLYAVHIFSLTNGYVSFPTSGQAKEHYERLFGHVLKNPSRDLAKIRDSVNIHLADNTTAAAYYLFQRREKRRFDFDSTITKGSTAAALIAAKYIWPAPNLPRTEFKRLMMTIPPSTKEKSRDQAMRPLFEDGRQDRFELLEKGRYIYIEQKGSEPDTVTPTPRLHWEETYLHLLTRDYLVAMFESLGMAVHVDLRDNIREAEEWDAWEELVRTQLESLLENLPVRT